MTVLPLLALQDIIPPLYEEELARIKKEIRESTLRPGSHVAILGSLYSGRDLLIKRLAEECKSTAALHTLTSPVKDVKAALEPYADAKLLFLNNAHYLATRKIGGFDQLEKFQSYLSTTETTVISGWNTTAWNYYVPVTGLDSSHRKVITLPPVQALKMQAAVLARYNKEITCINDASIKRSFFTSPVTHTIKIPGTSRVFRIPWISVDLNLLASVFAKRDREETPETALFFHLARAAKGNAGAAVALWNAALEFPEIRVSHIREPAELPEIFPDECHALVSILMHESVSREDLDGVTGEDTGRLLRSLAFKEITEKVGGNVRIRPILANGVLTHLTGMRMVS